MSNYYNLDGIVTALRKEVDIDECILAKWKEVTFPRKKDGKPFQIMSKNVNGASLHRKSYAMQQGENELQVVAWTKTSGYKTDEIDMYEIVRYMKDEKKKEKKENYLPKQSFLEQVYSYDADDMIDAVNARIARIEKRIEAHKKQIENAEHAFNAFQFAYSKALAELKANCGEQENCNNSTLYYMVKDTIAR